MIDFVSQTSGLQFQLVPLLRMLALSGAAGALLLLFRPILVGVMRAAWLLMFPRLSREEIIRRRQLRDRRLLQRLINSSTGPSQTAELHAMAARD